jgi:hypothetical protein
VQLLPNDPAQKLVTWNVPDTGYGLQTATALGIPTSWLALSGPDATNVVPPYIFTHPPGYHSALVPGADLAATNKAFFRLDGQSFIQLQVLMPGETNAPGTTTGKTGTPTSECVGDQFLVTINACDANWTILTSVTDGVSMTSNDADSSAPAGSPATSTLAGGTTQIPFNFGQTGTFTVTVTDTTTATIPAVTSSPTRAINCAAVSQH